MKKFDKFIAVIIFAFVILVVGVNIWTENKSHGPDSFYKVELNRVKKELVMYEEKTGNAPENIAVLEAFLGDDYKSIETIAYIEKEKCDTARLSSLVHDVPGSCLYETARYMYIIQYDIPKVADGTSHKLLITVIIICIAIVVFVLIYIRNMILVPFNKVTELPYELAKGNLAVPLEESPNRYFGKVLWGMDLLREHLEQSKEKELNLVREKKLLLLSISHDIKTPLSAIKLYAKAIERDLYKTEEKRREAAAGIEQKADEIEKYVSDIVDASSNDFINFDVKNGEFYTKSLFDKIKGYYAYKMQLALIDFSVDEGENILVKGDEDRTLEVVQNIVENAIKYGDGKIIRIKTDTDEEGYTISIYNTGAPIPDNELPHVFDSFFRGSNVGDRPGSGLGLYICRKLLHLMDGEIVAAGHRDGMCFKVTLRIA